MRENKKPFGLTPAEYDNLMQAVRYGAIIIITVLITFTVLAGVTRWFGYTPPPPANSLITPEATSFLDD
ncbi:MAG: hypothetical protein WBC91_13570 [Phototrophicaceae bacterium]